MPESDAPQGRDVRPARGGSVERKTVQRQSPPRPEADEDTPRRVYAGSRAAHACNRRSKVTGDTPEADESRQFGEGFNPKAVEGGDKPALACSIPGVDHGIAALFGEFEGGE